jgi:hypothetical protein
MVFMGGATREVTIRNNGVNWSKSIKIYIIKLFSETRTYEVGIASNCKSARCGEYVLKSCTNCPARFWSWFA